MPTKNIFQCILSSCYIEILWCTKSLWQWFSNATKQVWNWVVLQDLTTSNTWKHPMKISDIYFFKRSGNGPTEPSTNNIFFSGNIWISTDLLLNGLLWSSTCSKRAEIVHETSWCIFIFSSLAKIWLTSLAKKATCDVRATSVTIIILYSLISSDYSDITTRRIVQ